jgi:hypothetical protein
VQSVTSHNAMLVTPHTVAVPVDECSLVLNCLRQYAKRQPFLEYKNEWIEQYSLDERIIALEKAKEADDKTTAELEARVKELEAKLA